MATTYKVLGQQAPSATSATTLYTVPSSTSAILSTLTVCNRGTSAASFRVAVRPAGATLANEHYLFYDAEVGANGTVVLPAGLALATTDVITVYASTANLSFTASGVELT